MFIGDLADLESDVGPEILDRVIGTTAEWRSPTTERVTIAGTKSVLNIVDHGLLKLTRPQPDGRVVVSDVVWPAQVLMRIGPDDPDDGGTAVTAEAGSVLHVSTDRLDHLLASQPAVRDALHRYAYGQLLRSHRRTRDLMLADIETRVHRFLQEQCERAVTSEPTDNVEVRGVTQGEIAELLGVGRESVNRTLRRLADDGVIALGPKSICVLKPEHLHLRDAEAL